VCEGSDPQREAVKAWLAAVGAVESAQRQLAQAQQHLAEIQGGMS
jgi:exonuclease VII small subunit